MEICTTQAQLSFYLKSEASYHKKIGFVPTMGALHQGHISLVNEARQRADIVVVSIFVNPTQFNDPKDLEKYPRPIDQDIEKLEMAHCDVLFLPNVEEMYTGNEKWYLELNGLDTVLEGKHRPGHYQGVTQIVKKLFDLVKPDVAFFGQKDYQQFLVIAEMVRRLNIKVELVMVPTMREESGLAMSSRNIHLSAQEQETALALSRMLQKTKDDFIIAPIEELRQRAIQQLTVSPGLELEYFEICDGATLEPLVSKDAFSVVALVAAKVGQTRLIDNIILK